MEKKSDACEYFRDDIRHAAELMQNLCTVCRLCRFRLAPPLPINPAQNATQNSEHTVWGCGDDTPQASSIIHFSKRKHKKMIGTS